tara:strand:- start:59 stop:463 length:405 start_codon:yes stop_codon:yes gene_type:complete
MQELKLIDEENMPSWFEYPKDFIRTVNLGLLEFDVWSILDSQMLHKKYIGLKKRYPDRDLIPFAERRENDDCACWERGKGDKVVIIHDYASPGYESREEYESFWDWLRVVIEEMIEFDYDDEDGEIGDDWLTKK